MKKIKFLTSSIEIVENEIIFNFGPSLYRYIGLAVPLPMYFMLKENFVPYPILEITFSFMILLIVRQVLIYGKFKVSLETNSLETSSKLEPFGLSLGHDIIPLRTSIFFIEKPLAILNNTFSWNIYVKGFEREIVVFETLSASEIQKIESFLEQQGIKILREDRHLTKSWFS